MNNLQNKQLWPGQTMLNLVKHGQNKPIRFGLRTSGRSALPGFGPLRFLARNFKLATAEAKA
jgi:hypothetical protein